jgi:hypothetical protein
MRIFVTIIFQIFICSSIVHAADIELQWDGCKPVCAIFQDGILIGETDKQLMAVTGLDGRRCYVWKACNVVDGKPQQCEIIRKKGATEIKDCK